MKNVYLVSIALAISIACAAESFAQAPAQGSQVVIAGEIQPSSIATNTAYQVTADDVMSVSIVGFPDLTQQSVVVMQDGTVSLPLIGNVYVAGLTTAQVDSLLAKKWSRYVVRPSVSVALVQRHKQLITFAGYVLHPGSIDYRPNLHIVEAIAESGGPLASGIEPGTPLISGDMSKVTVSHRDGTAQTLDLSHPEVKAGTTVDILLDQGDVVYIPEQRDEFSVVGSVAHPGSYPYTENMTVLDALTAVGGITDIADLDDATLDHDGIEQKLNLDALLRHGDMSGNSKLAAGDRIDVPEGNRTYVYGAVVHPGFYTYKPGDRILDALNAAGGPLPNNGFSGPDMMRVDLVRIDKTRNRATVQQINVASFLRKGDMAGNVVMQPGDVLYIPDRKHGFQLSDVYGVLQGVNLLNEGAYISRVGLGQ